ncbi:hypothetical protein BKA69DRAFT_1083538 [Paraphysoderma sedebokerense]|nr:hypothetical protein BKA69DRAFT_1083538 [Paraphysoderma sedebokerense]
MLNFAISNPSYPALLLGDYTNKVVKQTFFDLYIPWRQPPDNFFRNCTVVCPSEKYVEMLPDKQLPTVSDWFDKRYMKEPSFRQENWKTAYELSLKYWPLQHAKQGNIVKSAKMKE